MRNPGVFSLIQGEKCYIAEKAMRNLGVFSLVQAGEILHRSKSNEKSLSRKSLAYLDEWSRETCLLKRQHDISMQKESDLIRMTYSLSSRQQKIIYVVTKSSLCNLCRLAYKSRESSAFSNWIIRQLKKQRGRKRRLAYKSWENSVFSNWIIRQLKKTKRARSRDAYKMRGGGSFSNWIIRQLKNTKRAKAWTGV